MTSELTILLPGFRTKGSRPVKQNAMLQTLLHPSWALDPHPPLHPQPRPLVGIVVARAL